MIKVALGFLLSIMLTNWVMSELSYFSPKVGSAIQNQFTTLSFPRHDQWGEIVTASNAQRLESDFKGGYGRFASHHLLKGLSYYLNPSSYFSFRKHRGSDSEEGTQYGEGSIFEPLFTTFATSEGGAFTSLISNLHEDSKLVRF